MSEQILVATQQYFVRVMLRSAEPVDASEGPWTVKAVNSVSQTLITT